MNNKALFKLSIDGNIGSLNYYTGIYNKLAGGWEAGAETKNFNWRVVYVDYIIQYIMHGATNRHELT